MFIRLRQASFAKCNLYLRLRSAQWCQVVHPPFAELVLLGPTMTQDYH